MEIIDFIIVIAGWIVGNIVFNKFEKHLPPFRRIIKLGVILTLLYAIGLFLGRTTVYISLAIMTIGMAILHIWWFPRHGINGLTAEPYDKYLELIRKMKRGKS